MTKNELNRDVRRLARRWQILQNQPSENLGDDKEREEIKAELRRLHNADAEAEYLGKREILIILSLNHSLREIPLHQMFLPCHKTAFKP